MAERPRRRFDEVLERWRPIAIALAGLVTVNVLLHVFVIRETVRVSGDREAILANERDRLGRQRAEVAELEATASKFACTSSDVEHVFEDVLSSKQQRMTAIQRELRRLARENRMDPERLSYTGSEVADTGLVQFGVSFPLSGPFEMLQHFIEDVESSPNFLIVSDISLTGDRSQGQNLRLQVRVATYFTAPSVEALEQAFPAMEDET